MTLVILAAGLGSRFGGLKQIEPVGAEGEFIIDYSVYDAIRAGFNTVAFIIKKDFFEAFRDTIGKRVSKHIKVEYVFQDMDYLPTEAGRGVVREKPWGTAHALFCCKDIVKEKFAVTNADDFYGKKSFELMAESLKSMKDFDEIDHYSMIGYMLRNTLTEYGHVARGLCNVNNDGHLINIDERTKIQRNNGTIQYFEDEKGWFDVDEDTVASMNFWGFTPTIFQHIINGWDNYIKESKDNITKAEYYIPVLVKSLLSDNKCEVKVISTPDRWQGVTYASDKPGVVNYIKALTAEGTYPVGLWG
ncbi:MAG: nucleotidyltransferase [Clostridiales bacterium GWF2_38_85]|nr:MAG: nucleotidyltransferase [Clostridiales bacterium GWF2_38_85]HBL83599.1 nucleotidyltransferase [Clostridiales bacterium]